jgi:hypothetical protein
MIYLVLKYREEKQTIIKVEGGKVEFFQKKNLSFWLGQPTQVLAHLSWRN